MADPNNTIAFQGAPGANSDMACRAVYPEMETRPCNAFEDAFEAVTSARAKYAMIPIDNSVAGRVADVGAAQRETRIREPGALRHLPPVVDGQGHRRGPIPERRLRPACANASVLRVAK